MSRCKHDLVYCGGYYNVCWFYCRICGEKITDTVPFTSPKELRSFIKRRTGMSINKNDCLDCDNLERVDILDPNSPLYCKATGEHFGQYPDLEVFEEDCPNFKYVE